MRRLLTAVALAGMAGLLLAACGKPGGVDGDLVNDWAPMAEAKPFVPEAGACHPAPFVRQSPLTHVPSGRLLGAASDRDRACRRLRRGRSGAGRPAARRLAGDPRRLRGVRWQGAGVRRRRVAGGAALAGCGAPHRGAWTGGARWFRCDMVELAMVQNAAVPVSRTRQSEGRADRGLPAAARVSHDAGGRRAEHAGVAGDRLRHGAQRRVRRRVDRPGDDRLSEPGRRLGRRCTRGATGCVATLRRSAGEYGLRYRAGVVAVPRRRGGLEGR